MGRPRKRWIDTVKDCWKKRGLDVWKARRVVHDMSVWRGFGKGNAWGVAWGDELLTLVRCYSCKMAQPYEALEGRKSVCGQVHNLNA